MADPAAELMAQGYWERFAGECVRIVFGRDDEWSFDVFMQIGTADAAPFYVNEDLVGLRRG